MVEEKLQLPKTRNQLLDDELVPDQESLYKVSVVLDISMKTRFAQHGVLFADLSCLDPHNFSEKSSLPVNAFRKKVAKR